MKDGLSRWGYHLRKRIWLCDLHCVVSFRFLLFSWLIFVCYKVYSCCFVFGHRHLQSIPKLPKELNYCLKEWMIPLKCSYCFSNKKILRVFKYLPADSLLTLILLMWRIEWAPNSIPIYIQQDATLHSLYLETALHVSCGTSTHHQ